MLRAAPMLHRARGAPAATSQKETATYPRPIQDESKLLVEPLFVTAPQYTVATCSSDRQSSDEMLTSISSSHSSAHPPSIFSLCFLSQPALAKIFFNCGLIVP